MVPLRRHASNATPKLHTSIPPCSQVRTAPPELQSSVPQRFHAYTSESRLQHSIPSYFPVATPYIELPDLHTSRLRVATATAGFQHSRPPSLHVATPVACLQCSNASYSVPPSSRSRDAAPELRTASLSRRIQSAPGPPKLHTSMPPCLHAGIAPPTLQTSKPPRRCTCSVPPTLQRFILGTSEFPDPRRGSGAPYLYASISTRRHRTFNTPCLHSSTSLHQQRFQSSRAAYLYASTSTRLRRASRAAELYASMLPCLHACRVPPTFLHTSMLIRLQIDSRAPWLHS